MPSVRVMFTTGFDGDTVVVRVDGKTATEHGPITTRGDVTPPLAWSVDIPVERETVSLDVEVPGKHASGTIQLNVTQFPQLDVALSGHTVMLKGSLLVPSMG